MRRLTIESWEHLLAEELAFADVESDELIEDGENHLLSCERDPHRWELDPASAEDYVDRHRYSLQAEKWRHLGH